MKKCVNCGAELPDEASFCPHCATTQNEKTPVAPPRPWRKKAFIIGLCAAVIAAIAIAAVARTRRPKTYEGDAVVSYTIGDVTYDIMASFSPGDFIHNDPHDERNVELDEFSTSVLPAMVGVLTDGVPLEDPSEFTNKVESFAVTTVPLTENSSIIYTEPGYSSDFDPAIQFTDLTYTALSGANEIRWTITMKNGDTIIVKNVLEVTPLYKQIFSPDENRPLDTMEELKALLAEINELPENIIADIYLPAVIYDGGLDITDRAVNLYGRSDGDSCTTFTGPVTVATHDPSNVLLDNLVFAGHGGTGLTATASVFMSNCRLFGWDVGAVCLDGGMIGNYANTFENNGVGFMYDTDKFSSFSGTLSDCHFTGNDVGVRFTRLSAAETIDFYGTEFSNNVVDIDNPIDYPIVTDNAIFW